MQIHLFPVGLDEAQRRDKAVQKFVQITASQAAHDRHEIQKRAALCHERHQMTRDDLQFGWERREELMLQRKQQLEWRQRQKQNTTMLKRRLVDRRHELLSANARWVREERRREATALMSEKERLRYIHSSSGCTGSGGNGSNGNTGNTGNHFTTTTTSTSSPPRPPPRPDNRSKQTFYNRSNQRVLRAVLSSASSPRASSSSITIASSIDMGVVAPMREGETLNESSPTQSAHYYIPKDGSFVKLPVQPRPPLSSSRCLTTTKTTTTTTINTSDKRMARASGDSGVTTATTMQAVPVRPQTAPTAPGGARSSTSTSISSTSISSSSSPRAVSPRTIPKMHVVVGGFNASRQSPRPASSTSKTPSSSSEHTQIVLQFQRREMRRAQKRAARQTSASKHSVRRLREKNVDRRKIVNKTTENQRASRPIVGPWKQRRDAATKTRTMQLVGKSNNKNRGIRGGIVFIPMRPSPEKRILPIKRSSSSSRSSSSTFTTGDGSSNGGSSEWTSGLFDGRDLLMTNTVCS